MNKSHIVTSTTTVLTSPSGEGMQLEVYAANEKGERTSEPFPIFTVLADDAETYWVEVYTARGPLRVPLAEVERAVAQAKKGVHGEAWYDKPKGSGA